MLAELERRLAVVLGNALPAPFAGRVRVAPEAPPGNGPAVLLRVRQAVPLPGDFGSVRLEPVPAPPARQRVVRLRCTVEVEVRPQQANDRAQVVAGVDALLYLLDAPDFRSAAALAEAGDPGFSLSALALLEAWPEPRGEGDPPQLTLRADGIFWPVGTEAETGVPIAEAHVRQVTLPLGAGAAPARIPAGGAPVDLRFVADRRGTMRLRGDGASAEPFGRLAFRLLGAEGGPGAGTLAGGAAGPGGSRLVLLADDAATVRYTPPAGPAEDRLLVHLVTGTGAGARLGPEVARATLSVEAGS